MQNEIDLGTKVKFTEDNSETTGTVHAVKTIDDKHGNRVVIAYLVDTLHRTKTNKEDPAETVEVLPENIQVA